MIRKHYVKDRSFFSVNVEGNVNDGGGLMGTSFLLF